MCVKRKGTSRDEKTAQFCEAAACIRPPPTKLLLSSNTAVYIVSKVTALVCILLVVVLRVSSSSKGGPFSVHYLYIAAYYRRNIESFFSDFFWALVCILHIAIGFFSFLFSEEDPGKKILIFY